jgi:hypothetical protein
MRIQKKNHSTATIQHNKNAISMLKDSNGIERSNHEDKDNIIWEAFRLAPVVAGLYITLAHTTSAFSLPLNHYGSSSRLQLLGYSSSISVFSLSVSTTIPDLTISEFISQTMNLRKQIE